jgi:hypothetical protein
MKLVFQRIDSLPPLSWCADIRTGSDEIVVRHGKWVETREDRFFEGAWNGSFEQGDFDLAETMAGSGGLIRDGRLTFSPPTDMYMWLVTIRAPNRLLVSNSLVFALKIAADKPAISYPYYFFDVMHRRRWGLRHKPMLMPTHNGHQIGLHPWNNIRVNADLTVEMGDRPRADKFHTYEQYRSLINTTVRDVLVNAAHPERIYPFRPVAGISQGYDSPAAAVAMAAAGCTEALTFDRSPVAPDEWTDNGSEIARCLGMKPTVYNREDYYSLTDLTDAEFCATATSGTGAPLALAQQQLEGAILSSGRPGEYAWIPDQDRRFSSPDLIGVTIRYSNTTSIQEFRLRVGYLHLAVPYIGVIHRPSLQRITLSPEMKPWWIEGDYNRPIPRRMCEEAGVPRELFGQHKMASNTRPTQTMPEAARRDFESFYQNLDIPPAIRRGRLPLWEYRKAPIDALYAMCLYLPGQKKWLWKWLPPLLLKSDRRAGARMAMSDLYLFHWAFDRINNRYDIDSSGPTG